MDALPVEENRRVHVRIQGIVQGVGFRPYIFQLAHRYALNGWVRNQPDGVEIEIAGVARHVEDFLRQIPAGAPPLAHIVRLEASEQPFRPLRGFQILQSKGEKARLTLISPDVCTCEDCLRELFEPENRRYRYPFINCTNCGPRYTIIKDIPYDRDKTTMAPFSMCPSCLREYEDPLDRRFHAQPNACWECGPQVWLEASDGRKITEKDEGIRAVIRLVTEGAIVAVKGLGGFHLVVHAADEAAVSRLRKRKVREEKPFAVMFSSLEVVRRYCEVNEKEAMLLVSPQRPIVLLKRRGDPSCFRVAAGVAPGNRFLGAFLPYTPLHHLLFDRSPCEALVMTSGNQSDEPIVMTTVEARWRLKGIADFFLFHDREIHMRCDDSVARVIRGERRPLRRARGYVPVPVFLREAVPSVLGVGAELKNTVCLIRRNEAFLSQHIGDLENLETLHSFEQTISHLERILEIRPECIAHDLHPDYLSTRWALQQRGVSLLAVQHHHAHIASVVAERKIDGPLLGLALDGTGYGPDGTLWGGEILRVEGYRWERLGHFRHVPLPGGHQAIKEPWRMALSYLWSLFGGNVEQAAGDFFQRHSREKVRILLQMLDRRVNAPITSSCGRLFDAVAALAGVRDAIVYEGQAAVELEQILEPCEGRYEGRVAKEGGLWIVDPFPIIDAVVQDVTKGAAPGAISAKFHNGLIALLAETVRRAGLETGLNRVALSGGVFQNAYLSEHLEMELRRSGFEVYSHLEVPANDACIALGQAYIAGQWLKAQR